MPSALYLVLAAVIAAGALAQVDQGEAMTISTATTSPIADRSAHTQREGDRVWVEGVRGYGFHQRVSSVHSAQAAILEYLGESVTYDELVGHSGLAFRVQVHPEFCPSSPHPCCGFRCIEPDSNPWQTRHVHMADLKAENPEHAERIAEVRRQVRQSIDRGMPVHYGDIEDGVIVGYQAGGEEWLCFHPLHDGAGKIHVEKTLSWGVVLYERPRAVPVTRRDRARRAMEQAVTMWRTSRSPEADGYFVGEAAWGFWIGELEKLSDATPEAARKIQHGNAWIYDALTACRRSAAKYLRIVAADFEPAQARHLLRAAELYEQMADSVLSDAEHCVVTIAPYVNKDPWTATQRAEQVRRMRVARDLDAQAIAELEAALAE